MSAVQTIYDPRCERAITPRDADRIMYDFALEFERRGDLPVSAFTAYAGLLTNGCNADPAALDDFLAATAKHVAARKEADNRGDPFWTAQSMGQPSVRRLR